MLGEHTRKISVRVPTFVLSLYKILSDQSYSDMIAWESCGTRFVVKDHINFASKVLPQHYETSKFASFSRQLNIYGFYRVSDRRRTKQSSDLSTIIYSHPYFKRDHPNSLHLIQRMSGPYSQAKTRVLIPEVKTQVQKASMFASLPSPTSPTAILFSSLNSHEREGYYVKEPASDCTNCVSLRQEITSLSKVIEYYLTILEEPSSPEKSPSFYHNQDFWTFISDYTYPLPYLSQL